MSYNKETIKSGEVISSKWGNKIEEGIYNAHKDIEAISSKVNETTREISNLKSSVVNGKDSLYSAIIGKKITPRSKDFADLVKGVKDIKLGQGNAQPGDVLQGKTFTNDNGIVQTGNMTNYGSKVITPTAYNQNLGNGYYSGITVKGDSNLKPENIKSGVNICGVTGNMKSITLIEDSIILNGFSEKNFNLGIDLSQYYFICSISLQIKAHYRQQHEDYDDTVYDNFIFKKATDEFIKKGNAMNTYVNLNENSIKFTVISGAYSGVFDYARLKFKLQAMPKIYV